LLIAEVTAWPLNDGGIPVDLFVILSGFVITLLVNKRPEPYRVYIFRRFMRLYPLYLIALGLGVVTQRFAPLAIAPVLFGQDSNPSWYAVIHGADILPNLVFHILMLHGVVPDTVLPNATTAFSGPLWSISLEWQFYLAAPLFVWLLDIRHRQRLPWAAIGTVGILAAQAIAGRLWHANEPAFLPLRMFVFAVGIVSGHLWEAAQRTSYWKVGGVWAGWVLILLITHRNYVPFIPWGITYTIAASQDRCFGFRAASRILMLRPLRWIGERSYGIYVLHWPILIVVAATLIVPHAKAWGQTFTLISLLSVFPLVIVVAAALYRFVETPAIRWGRTKYDSRSARHQVGMS
jgi:peptidoglycan/LPS O-acetylase OafA/YrhL